MFAKNLSRAFLYEKGQTLLHKLDPRIKLIYSLLSTILIFTAKTPLQITLILIIQLVIVAASKLTRKIALLIKGIIPLLLVLITFNTILYYLVTLEIDPQLLAQNFLMMTLRVLTTLTLFTALMITTSPQEIMQALVKLGVSYVYAYPLVIVYRFIPIIFTEMSQVYDAQRSRGLELEKGNIVRRARKLVPIIIPTIICALFRAKDLAEAMESRGFGSNPNRTFYKTIKIGKRDIIFLVLSLTSQILIVILK